MILQIILAAPGLAAGAALGVGMGLALLAAGRKGSGAYCLWRFCLVYDRQSSEAFPGRFYELDFRVVAGAVEEDGSCDMVPKLTFGQALEALNGGCRAARQGWNGKGMWIARQNPDEHGTMTRPYIYMKTADEQLVPWVAGQTDLLAEDWEVVGG